MTDDRENRRSSAVEQYTRQQSDSSEAVTAESTGEHYDREPVARGPALSLNLLLKNGNAKTVEYAHRTEVDFDPEIGIEMYFTTGLKITIIGEHLGQLYEDLALHRVLRIRSSDKLHALSQVSEINGHALPVVTDLVIERGRLDVDTGLWRPAQGNWSSEKQSWQAARVLN